MGMMKKRPFNEDAYDSMDMKSKVALVEMMCNKGYELVGDINIEEYKKWDLEFQKGKKKVSFEIEMRQPFNKIKTCYNTVHVPIRKKNNQSDYYIVWNLDCTEFAIIETQEIRRHAKDENLIYLECNEGKDWNYKEHFIDVPKEEWKFFKINNKGEWLEEDMSKIECIEYGPNPERLKQLFND